MDELKITKHYIIHNGKIILLTNEVDVLKNYYLIFFLLLYISESSACLSHPTSYIKIIKICVDFEIL